MAQDELLWAYCVLRASDSEPDALEAIDRAHPVERVEAGELAVLVSRVPRAEFGEEPLRTNLNDLAWLARVARAHEAVLEQTGENATIVPLRLCTLYDSEESVVLMLMREHDTLTDALAALDGRQEWGVKVLVDSQKFSEHVRAQSDEAGVIEAESEGRGDGGAYLLRRRLERHLRALGDSVAAGLADEVHSRSMETVLDGVVLRPQNRELSKHEGVMILNAAYLVERSSVDALRAVLAELEQRYGALGVRIELTGPWPPYNFVPQGGAATVV